MAMLSPPCLFYTPILFNIIMIFITENSIFMQTIAQKNEHFFAKKFGGTVKRTLTLRCNR